MPTESKIIRYNLQGKCLELFDAHYTTAEIAEALTQILAEQNIYNRAGNPETISQPTVSRFLKPVRNEVREEMQEAVTNHIKANVANDLAIADEIESVFVTWFRGQDGKNIVPRKERATHGMNVIKIIETKIKLALGDSDKEKTARDLVSEIEDSLDAGVKEKIDAIRSGTSAERVSGYH